MNINLETEHILKLVNNTKRNYFVKHLKKSIRLVFLNATMSPLEDDFIKDLSSIIIRYEWFKVPRIVSNFLLKKYKK